MRNKLAFLIVLVLFISLTLTNPVLALGVVLAGMMLATMTILALGIYKHQRRRRQPIMTGPLTEVERANSGFSDYD